MGIDIDPSADRRTVQVVADLCAAPFADRAFDTSVCFHVFEHIPDDLAGHAGIRPDAVTNRDRIHPEPVESRGLDSRGSNRLPRGEAAEKFGQADHVRMYGADFEDRLRSAGLEPRRVLPEHVLSELAIQTMGITPQMPIWIVFGSKFKPGSSDEPGSRRTFVEMSLDRCDSSASQRDRFGHRKTTSS